MLKTISILLRTIKNQCMFIALPGLFKLIKPKPYFFQNFVGYYFINLNQLTRSSQLKFSLCNNLKFSNPYICVQLDGVKLNYYI